MEERNDGACRLVYFCAAASSEEPVHELYHSHSPPHSSAQQRHGDQPALAPLDRARTDARALLDVDIGGFDEVFISSRAQDCVERIEACANTSPVAVLIDFTDAASQGAVTPGFLKDEAGAFAFLRSLSADVQGARYQQHVMPFALVEHAHSDDPDTLPDASVTSTLLSAGAIDIVRTPLLHDDMNHLVGHVKEATRPPALLLGAAMAQNLISSIRDSSSPKPSGHRPDQIIPPARRAAIELAISSWRFPAHEYSMDELTYAVLCMVEHLLSTPELKQYSIPRSDLITLLLATRRQYKHSKEVCYHNWRHAVDVTQCIFYTLLKLRLCPHPERPNPPPHKLNDVEQMLTPLHALILLVSAIGHDVGHPGVNNAFLVACNHPLAQLYNDKSVLENYHCAAYSQLLRRHWPALINIPNFRTMMISTILATDMQRHFEYMGRLADLKQKVRDSEMSPLEWPEKEQDLARELIMSLLLKAADISNVARPYDISAQWAEILMHEFSRQGELEAELQIPSCLFGGPPVKGDRLAAAQSQKGFMSLFGAPLSKGISDVMPSLSDSCEELETNRVIWDKKIEEEKQTGGLDGEDSHLTFSSVTRAEVEQAVGKHKSDPAVMPAASLTSSQKRTPASRLDSTGSRPSTHEHSSAGVTFDETQTQRPSTPHLSVASVPLSPRSASSRRSSKDMALDQLQQWSVSANSTFAAGSRRGSADGGVQIHHSYPSSRRGSKDESLTTIVVTSGLTPPVHHHSPPLTAANPTQKLPTAQKRSALRTSLPSSLSTATVTTSQPSTQPSSLSPDDDTGATLEHYDALHPSINHSSPTAEEPFATPTLWSEQRHASHRPSVPTATNTIGLPSDPSPQPLSSESHAADAHGRIGRAAAPASADPCLTSPRSKTSEQHQQAPAPTPLLHSRSRSRLRGLRFWRKRRDLDNPDDPAGARVAVEAAEYGVETPP